MAAIKIGIIGVGNCASALLQGVAYYRRKNRNDAIGILHWSINGYTPGDIEVVSAFDIDQRKVGKDVHNAIFELPNCTQKFVDHMPRAEVTVSMGKILDGFAEHMKNYEPDYTFLLCDQKEPTQRDVVEILKDSGTEILLNYLPVGSENATRFYAECAVEAGVGFIN
ncbi:MAG: inositol-3-phosphate synthase, partial [Deltaproteobacteria bacterium]|nr:inositol-3-phosphate synthase [Deltaproteobacteria bacterium]